MIDLVIIGGGPAGAAAAVYAARKRLSTVLITPEFGGQSSVSTDIQNWIGTRSISGTDLAKNLEDHVRAYVGQGLEVKNARATKLLKKEGNFVLETDNGENIEARAVLIATGSERRKLTIPGAAEFDNKGVTYCASCDGPLFAGMDVVVIGGGNAGLETAAQLAAYCTNVTLMHKYDTLKGDSVTQEAVRNMENVTIMLETEPTEILGERFVSGVKFKKKDGEEGEIAANGVFVEIGSLPSTGFAKDLIELDPAGHIIVDPRTQRTSVEGIWAAGDATDGLYHQNNIAAGDAVKALENLYIWLKQQK